MPRGSPLPALLERVRRVCDARGEGEHPLLLDLAASYRRLNARGNRIYRYLTARWPDALHRRFAT